MLTLNTDFLGEYTSTNNLETVIDTDKIDKCERIEFWHDFGSKVYVTHQPRIKDANKFVAQAKCAAANNYEVSLAIMQGSSLERTAADTKNDDSERCFLAMLIDGDLHFSQNNTVLHPKAGEIFLIDTSEPYQIFHNSKNRLLHIMVPRSEIERRIGNLHPYLGRTTSPESPIGNTAAFLMHKAAFALSHSGEAHETQIIETMVDITTQALSEATGIEANIPFSSSDLLLTRLEACLHKQFRNPSLALETLANMAGMNIYQANRLLAQQGTTLVRWVQEMRLQYAAQMLADQKKAAHPITKIASTSGFSDTPYFSRAFHHRFGIAPEDYRDIVKQQPSVTESATSMRHNSRQQTN